jgi:adenylate cyclase class 2
MFEIELKAWVDNPQETRKALNAFANFCGTWDKRDTYWHLDIPHVTVRIREERNLDREQPPKTLVTYKRKELRRAGAKAAAVEVNDEQEFSISDAGAFTAILQDTGFAVRRTKHKIAEQFRQGKALLELCAVEGLGDFLEIEIMAEHNDEATVASARAKLEALLEQAGIPLSAVESRYYIEMLEASTKRAENASAGR